MDTQFPKTCDMLSPCGRLTWSRRGIGSPRAERLADAALWVAMRPSTFLALATHLASPRASLAWLHAQADAGASLCPPTLEAWMAGTRSVPVVVRHDGRHRATLAESILSDAAIPVLLRLRGPGASQPVLHLAALARRGMQTQQSGAHVAGPLFDVMVEEDTRRFPSGLPPPQERSVVPIRTSPAWWVGGLALKVSAAPNRAWPAKARRGKAGRHRS